MTPGAFPSARRIHPTTRACAERPFRRAIHRQPAINHHRSERQAAPDVRYQSGILLVFGEGARATVLRAVRKNVKHLEWEPDTMRRVCVVWHAGVGLEPSDLGSLDSIMRADTPDDFRSSATADLSGAQGRPPDRISRDVGLHGRGKIADGRRHERVSRWWVDHE